MQAAANEEADIQRALQETREIYGAMRSSRRLAMFASAANYRLAATLRARVDGAGPSRVYPSGSTPLNRKLSMIQIATTKSYPPTRTRISFVVPHDMSM